MSSKLIFVDEKEQQFHLTNHQISYIFKVNEFGKLAQLYFGKKIHHRPDFSHLYEEIHRPTSSNPVEGNLFYSPSHIKQEFPEYGTGDYRKPAISIRSENGSLISDFKYHSHQLFKGKPTIKALPQSYVETDSEAETLVIILQDALTNIFVELSFTIFSQNPVIARNVRVINHGEKAVMLEQIMSLNLDLPDSDYQWLQLSGAWSRERHVITRDLTQGMTSIDSTRGASSHEHNPFIALKRKECSENSGEVIGATLVYSGNFLISAEVDTFDVTRLQLGINPFGFSWHLEKDSEFQSPEALLVYSDQGMNGMSQTFHHLLRTRVARGQWRDKVRPIAINNWEATYFDFDEHKLVNIAKKAQKAGIELFVLDDGWFGKRINEHIGLGDWKANTERLPNGISGIAEKVTEMGMLFGLWFEPEMVNLDSELYRQHPEWLLATPNRSMSHGRNQYVLNFANQAVVHHIFKQMTDILSGAKVSYVKWDMNRMITEAYDTTRSSQHQGEVFHRYILGVYQLYELLVATFPNILFESCASGGGRFDVGMLYYAPQAWTSDDTDAIERLKIQYGTSFIYPLSSLSNHVSSVPNHQTNRLTSIETRFNVAQFGILGYELDLNELSEKEFNIVKEQVKIAKKQRDLIQNGLFYRLDSPFEKNIAAWSVVSRNQQTILLAKYKVLNHANQPYQRIYLQGLNPSWRYCLKETGQVYYGDELMNAGFVSTDSSAGEVKSTGPFSNEPSSGDYYSKVWYFEKIND